MGSNFVFQDNQYRGALLPCTSVDFNRIVDSQDVAWRITTRQQVENAIAKGLPLDAFWGNSKFQNFCQKHATEESFKRLSQAPLPWKLHSTIGCHPYRSGET